MNERQKETLNVRIISVGFSCLAFVVFKPLGIGELGLTLYLHFLIIWLLGIGICFISEAILKNLVKMPAALDKGAEYIIRRNLWFQLVNSPLEALFICIYLHFAMSSLSAPDPLSLKGFLQVLLVLAFCSFAIGLYWRYKFRSRYLAMELEETKMLNQQLKMHTQPTTDGETSVTLTGTTSETVTVSMANLLYIEAVGNYLKVYQWQDEKVRCDMLRTTSKQMEHDLKDYPMVVRCHRAFLVNLRQVERVVVRAGSMQLQMSHCQDTIPVSRSNMAAVKEAIRR